MNGIPAFFEGHIAAGYRVYKTRIGCIARKGPKVKLPHQFIKKLRRRLFAKFREKCHYCGERVYLPGRTPENKKYLEVTIEHRTPLSRGGTWKANNLACACKRCNNAKTDLTEEEFLEIMAQFPPEPSGKHFAKILNAVKNKHNEIKRAQMTAKRMAEAEVVSEIVCEAA